MASNNSNDTHNDPNLNRQSSSQKAELNEEHNTTFERSVYTKFLTFVSTDAKDSKNVRFR